MTHRRTLANLPTLEAERAWLQPTRERPSITHALEAAFSTMVDAGPGAPIVIGASAGDPSRPR